MSLQEVADTQAIFTLLAADGLEVRGMVDIPTVWTGEQISEMGMIDVRFLNSSGEEMIYRGAPS